MMDTCKIVADLLPSYCDGLTSPESAALVEEHIAQCPCCAGTLVAMKNRQSDAEQEEKMEEFRSALYFYEFRHKLRTLWIVLACAVAVICFFVLQTFSMELALLSKGVSLEHMEVVSTAVPHYQGEPENTTYGHLIWSRDGDDNAVLAYLRKNFLGFWYVDSLVTAGSANGYNPDFFIWTEIGVSRYGSNFDHYTIAHVVCAGNNAVKYIEYPQDTLPENSVARVYQKHDHYMVYITTVLESGTHYVWNVRDILEEHGFITTADQK